MMLLGEKRGSNCLGCNTVLIFIISISTLQLKEMIETFYLRERERGEQGN
jgi:hypothetical protein